MIDKKLEEEKKQAIKDVVVRNYLKYIIDELNPSQLRSVLAFVVGVRRSKKKAPVTDQSTQGATKNIQFEDTTESGKSQLGGF